MGTDLSESANDAGVGMTMSQLSNENTKPNLDFGKSSSADGSRCKTMHVLVVIVIPISM
jgi:hypothetical protein